MKANPYAIYNQELKVGDRSVLVDQEGYLQDLNDWSEDFVRALAAKEELNLSSEHWDVIRFIRHYYLEHQVQPQVREMIKHFRESWGPDKGNNRYLHDIFPIGGPQKQGNRLAGIRRTKGEH